MSRIADLYQADRALRRQRVDAEELRLALDVDQLQFYFQPVVCAGRVVSAEALVRWHLPDGTVRFPGPWLNILEGDEALSDLFDDCLWAAAVAFGASWPDLRVNVNTVPSRVAQAGWADRTLGRIAVLGGRAGQFTVEITEGALLCNTPTVRDNLALLRLAGCHVALDDFGEGQANLVTFMEFSDLLDTVKVDQKLIRHPDHRAAVSLIYLARAFEKHVVAEGVETEEQAEWLRTVGVGCHQGWLYAKALPPAQFAAYALTLV